MSLRDMVCWFLVGYMIADIYRDMSVTQEVRECRAQCEEDGDG